MVMWIIVGAVFGLMLGYALSGIMGISSKESEIDNMQSYCDSLEEENASQRELIRMLREQIKSFENNDN